MRRKNNVRYGNSTQTYALYRACTRSRISLSGKYAANGVGITGWVRNEWDGSVELEVQGTEEQINHMLVMINRSDYIVIDNIESKQIPLEEHEAGFHVRSRG